MTAQQWSHTFATTNFPNENWQFTTFVIKLLDRSAPNETENDDCTFQFWYAICMYQSYRNHTEQHREQLLSCETSQMKRERKGCTNRNRYFCSSSSTLGFLWESVLVLLLTHLSNIVTYWLQAKLWGKHAMNPPHHITPSMRKS